MKIKYEKKLDFFSRNSFSKEDFLVHGFLISCFVYVITRKLSGTSLNANKTYANIINPLSATVALILKPAH